jgi:hypothetical protein
MGTVTVKLDLSQTGFSRGITDARWQAKQLGDSLKEVGAHGASSMQAASAAIRVLEGGMTGNIRAAERFISMLPGVGKALQAAFPVVGGIALVGVFARVAEEIYKTVHNLQQIRNVANESFNALTAGSERNADSLRVTNDKLEQEIAMLEHKPVNNMALALDEARLRADDLAKSLDTDYQSFKKIIEETQKGMFAQLFSKGVDPQLGNGMNDQLANIRTLARQQKAELAKGNQDAADDLGTKLRAAQDAALSFADSETAKRNGMVGVGTARQSTYAGTYGNQDQNFDAINAFKDLVGSQEDTADEQKRNTADQARQRALEQGNKAQAELLSSMQEGIAKQKAQYGVSVADELAYWSARINAFSSGSNQYKTVLMDTYRLQAELYEQLMEGKKKYLASAKSDVEGNDILGNAQKALITSPAVEEMQRAARANEEYNKIVAAGAELQAKSTAEFRESGIAIALQEGGISKLGAAQALAAVHAQEHADALAIVNRELKTQIDLIQGDTKLNGDDQALAIRNAQAEAAKQTQGINGTYAVTQQRDSANIYQNTGAGAAADTYRTMLQNWSDMTQNIAQAMARAADSFNSDIAAAITGHGKKGDFGKTFSNLGESLVKASLQKGESMLFGGGQLGATQQNPVWTRDAGIAGGPGATGTPNLSPFIRPFIGGQQGQGGQSGSQGGGSILSRLLGAFIPGLHLGGGGNLGTDSFGMPLGFQGGFSGGGDVLAGRPALIGEHGPELFTPHSAGTITPNSKLGGGDTHFHIDARGSSDPAAVHAAVMRAAPHIAAAGVQATHQNKMRSPGGR